MRTVAHLYDTYETAQRVVNELEAAGFSHDHVSIVANQSSTDAANTAATTGTMTSGTTAPEAAGTGAGTGASIGTIIGGGAGLLAGIGALAIPGVGPVIAAGWLIATLTGAGAGAAGRRPAWLADGRRSVRGPRPCLRRGRTPWQHPGHRPRRRRAGG